MGYAFLSIGIGAVLGAWMRWGLGLALNSLFSTIPLGTLAANIIGGFLMGIFMAATKNHTFLPETARLALSTGFLGALTTFSAFSAETVTLLSHQEYFWSAILILAHVLGSIAATIFGWTLLRFFIA